MYIDKSTSSMNLSPNFPFPIFCISKCRRTGGILSWTFYSTNLSTAEMVIFNYVTCLMD